MTMYHLPAEKKLLFDGQDEGFYTFKSPFNIPHEVTVYERDFRKNYFNDLEKIMSPDAFEKLLKEGLFSKSKGSLKGYLGSDGLSLNYFMVSDFLLIFANGEFQPDRYKIYLEGIWQIG